MSWLSAEKSIENPVRLLASNFSFSASVGMRYWLARPLPMAIICWASTSDFKYRCSVRRDTSGCQHRSGTLAPSSFCFKKANIWLSVNRDLRIENSLIQYMEFSTYSASGFWGGDYRSACERLDCWDPVTCSSMYLHIDISAGVKFLPCWWN